jgi:hypothetical protein
LLKHTPSDTCQRCFTERYSRRNPVLAAEQFALTKQRAAFLAVDYRAVGLTVLDEDLDLAFEHDPETSSFIALVIEMMTTPVTPDHGVFEEEITIAFRQYHGALAEFA